MKVYGMDLRGRLFYKGEALLREGSPFFVPHVEESWCAIPSLAVKIGRTGKCVATPFTERYVDSCAAGWDITCSSLLAELSCAGAPWERAKVYDGSSVALDWHPIGHHLPEQFALTVYERSVSLSQEYIRRGITILSECLTIHTGDVLLINVLPIDQAPTIAPGRQLSLQLHIADKIVSTTPLRIK